MNRSLGRRADIQAGWAQFQVHVAAVLIAIASMAAIGCQPDATSVRRGAVRRDVVGGADLAGEEGGGE